MHSGDDLTGEGLNRLQQFGSFHLTQAAAKASGGSGIDWAQLAQQWIQMKDKSGAATIEHVEGAIPIAPPPPNICGHPYQTACFPHRTTTTAKVSSNALRKTAYDEKGEADMDMDDEDESHIERMTRSKQVQQPAKSSNCAGVRPSVMQSSEWFAPEVVPTAALPTYVMPGLCNLTPAAAAWNLWPASVNVPPPPITVALPLSTVPSPTAHIPSLLKINVLNPNTTKIEAPTAPPCPVPTSIDDACSASAPPLDAAKRKTLPAWIREGLEKMEREKQRQMERVQQRTEACPSESVSEAGMHGRSELLDKLVTVKDKSTVNLASDGSSGEEELQHENLQNATKNDAVGDLEEEEDIDGSVIPYMESVAGAAEDPSNQTLPKDVLVSKQQSQKSGKTYDQRLAELMISVRRTLTELLLEVTNAEISAIAHESIQACKIKASSAQVVRKSALSTITSKLGLAAYEDSSSGNDSSTENETEPETAANSAGDSEEEIRNSLRAKRRNFARIASEIEEYAAACAQREERKLKHYLEVECKEAAQTRDTTTRPPAGVVGGNGGGSKYSTAISAGGGKVFDREFGERTEPKIPPSNGGGGKRSALRKERTTRFSDNKDPKSGSGGGGGSSRTTTRTATYVGLAPKMPLVKHIETSSYKLATAVDSNGLYIAAPTAPSQTSVTDVSSAVAGSTERNVRKRFPTSPEERLRGRTHRRQSKTRQHNRKRRHSSESSSSSTASSSSSNTESAADASGSLTTSATSSSSNTSSSSRHIRASSGRIKRLKRSDKRREEAVQRTERKRKSKSEKRSDMGGQRRRSQRRHDSESESRETKRSRRHQQPQHRTLSRSHSRTSSNRRRR